ncbi:hypothetical protein [Nostoc sp.]|uniref:hypothetical protein n=1 Tax=Nostoc sp. TaxID=1180 RepID=UPI002FF81C56
MNINKGSNSLMRSHPLITRSQSGCRVNAIAAIVYFLSISHIISVMRRRSPS